MFIGGERFPTISYDISPMKPGIVAAIEEGGRASPEHTIGDPTLLGASG